MKQKHKNKQDYSLTTILNLYHKTKHMRHPPIKKYKYKVNTTHEQLTI